MGPRGDPAAPTGSGHLWGASCRSRTGWRDTGRPSCIVAPNNTARTEMGPLGAQPGGAGPSGGCSCTWKSGQRRIAPRRPRLHQEPPDPEAGSLGCPPPCAVPTSDPHPWGSGVSANRGGSGAHARHRGHALGHHRRPAAGALVPVRGLGVERPAPTARRKGRRVPLSRTAAPATSSGGTRAPLWELAQAWAPEPRLCPCSAGSRC